MGAFSDSAQLVPLTDVQKNEWKGALAELDDTFLPALAWQSADNPHKRVYVASFDGTWNDREHLKPNEAPTNPALLESELSQLYDGKHLTGQYYSGVGTRENTLMTLLDGMTGNGCEQKAEQAFADFQKQAQEWIKEDPNAQIHVFAMGFSRGAASARHFLNLVDERGVPADNGTKRLVDDPFIESQLSNPREEPVYSSYLRQPGTVTSSALLYDTVATGQEAILKLGIPASTRFAVHFTSQDEDRKTFPLTAIGERTPDKSDIARFMTISLPGVHSDIGGGYTEGVAKLGRYLGEQTLYRLGFDVKLGDAPLEALTEGVHKHSHPFATSEDLLGIPLPEEQDSRRTEYVPNNPLTDVQRNEVLSENREMTDEAALRYVNALSSGTAPKDPLGLENVAIALVPHANGEVSVVASNADAVKFDEHTNEIQVYGRPVRTLSQEDFDMLKNGEPVVDVFSVRPDRSVENNFIDPTAPAKEQSPMAELDERAVEPAM